ncbi:MAG: NADH-quinone oxidoreductase subunit H [Caldimonas sp.]
MTAATSAAALLLMLGGAWLAAVFDRVAAALVARRPIRSPWLAPLQSAAASLARLPNRTEHPDGLNWALAPALYLALAFVGMALVPFSTSGALVDLPAGIVLWGAVESLTVVAVFLHGWSANSLFPLIGAYRYVAIGLPVMLVSMFVLIAAALPAQSLALGAIVQSQAGLWNIVRQPLGLPLFLLLGLSLTLRGPFNYADSADLAGGTDAERSGPPRALWQWARLSMAVSFSAMAATVFLGGPLGPAWGTIELGPLWLAAKTVVVLALLVAASHLLARMPPSRMLTLLWTVLLPLSFVGLVAAGIEAAL